MHHSCIDSAALLTRVLHAIRVRRAYRLTVGVKIHNPAFCSYVEEHGFPSDKATAKASDDAGGLTIVLGKEAENIPEDRWPGHLTVIVPIAYGERHALLDPSITQLDDPKYGIKLQPLVLPVTADFVSGERASSFKVNKSLLRYQAYPDDHSYKDGSDAMQKAGIDAAVSEVVAKLKLLM